METENRDGFVILDEVPPRDSLPPHSLEVERSALACILLDPEEAIGGFRDAGADGLWFYDLRHREIYLACLRAYDRGAVPDLVTVHEELRAAGQDSTVLVGLPDCAPSAANLPTYLDRLRKYHQSRQLIRLLGEVRQMASNPDHADRAVETIESGLHGIAGGSQKAEARDIGAVVHRVLGAVEEAWRSDGNPVGMLTGFPDIDRLLGGFKAGQLIVLGGLPSRGKTSLALNFIERIAVVDGQPSALFSLEMGAEEVGLRLLCGLAGVDCHRAGHGRLHDEEIRRLTNAAARLTKAPLWIEDQGTMTVAGLRARARRLARRHGLKFLAVDYLQLLGGSRLESRTVEVSEVSRGLKQCAKELGLPVLALSQFSREAARGDREPRLSDLRDSGSIEQDADLVLLLDRRSVEDTEATLAIAKNRSGPVGRVRLVFRPELTRFACAAPASVEVSE